MAFDWNSVDLDGMLSRTYKEMNPLQRAGVSLGRLNGRVIFDVYMGVGKTVMGLTLGLCFKPQRWVIICSKNALFTWQNEIIKWYPELSDESLYNVVRGTKEQRQKVWRSKGLFYVTTMGSFIRDIDWLIEKKVSFDVITVDEPQKVGLRNRKTAGFSATKRISDKKHFQAVQKKFPKRVKRAEFVQDISCINFLTGTLTSKGVPQLWSYLHLLDRKLFSSYWKFLSNYMLIVNGPHGKIPTIPKNQESLARITKPYIFKASEEEAKHYLPPIKRIPLYYELPDRLLATYRVLEEHMFIALEEGGIETTASILSLTTKLRQFIVCPKIVDPNLDSGPAIDIIIDKIMDNQEHSHFKHNLIFTPFIPTLPIFKKELAEKLSMPESDILIMQGGMELEEVGKAEKTFRSNMETLALCSIKFSQSFNFETALNCYFTGFEWDDDDNKQAESRARRTTSDKSRTIMSYLAHARGTISDDIYSIILNKRNVNKLTYRDLPTIHRRMEYHAN